MIRAQTAAFDASGLPRLPPDWRYELVSALGQPDEQAVLTGPFGTNLGRSDFVDHGVPVLTIGCLTEGGINLDKALYVTEEKARELERYRLRGGDLLFSRMASVGRAGMVPKSLAGALFNYHIMRLRLDESRIDPRVFINYVRGAQQVRDYLKAVNHGATRDGINTEQLLRLPIAVPPRAEQREIVSELEKQFSRLDEAVANLKRGKANLKRYKAAVLKAAVEGSLVPAEADLARREERAFESGSDLLARIIDSRKSKTADSERPQEANKFHDAALTPLREGWAWAEIDQLLAGIEAGASFKCVERPPRLGETGVLKVSAVTWGTFNEEESKTCVDLCRVREEFLVKPDDFLFSRANTIELVGACVIVRSVTKRLMLSDKTLRFRLRPLVLPEWLLACLRSEHGRGEITRLATGNQESMRNIGQDRIRRIRIPMPPLAEQRRILAELDRRLSTIDSAEQSLNASFNRVQHFKQAALAQQFGAVAGELA